MSWFRRRKEHVTAPGGRLERAEAVTPKAPGTLGELAVWVVARERSGNEDPTVAEIEEARAFLQAHPDQVPRIACARGVGYFGTDYRPPV